MKPTLLIQKPDKNSTEKESYRPISLMNIGSTLFDIGLSSIFLHLSLQARATKVKINVTISN